MKLLFVTPRFPYPLLKGDQVVVYHRLRVLSRRHEITLLSLYEREEELAGLDQLRPYCRDIHTVRLQKWRSALNVLARAPISRLPLQVLYYQAPEFRKKLTSLLESGGFELVHAFLLRVAPDLEGAPVPVVLDLIDSMRLNLERRVTRERAPRCWVFAEELRRVVTFEGKLPGRFPKLLVVSDLDRSYLPGGQTHVVPNGVDTEAFSPGALLCPDPVIVFSGNMRYAPNIHAVTWFVGQCWPRVRAEIPRARLEIVGASPTPEIRALSQEEGISVTGFVPSMVGALRQARVAIAPMQSGSGIQNKILEAMSCGLPVVATTLGLGSIQARPGQEVVVADAPDKFADAVIELLLESSQATELGASARDFVMRRYSWEHAATQVEEIYGQALAWNAQGAEEMKR